VCVSGLAIGQGCLPVRVRSDSCTGPYSDIEIHLKVGLRSCSDVVSNIGQTIQSPHECNFTHHKALSHFTVSLRQHHFKGHSDWTEFEITTAFLRSDQTASIIMRTGAQDILGIDILIMGQYKDESPVRSA
jgi:hypothetical protein